MKKRVLFLVLIFIKITILAQNYPNILNYNFNGTPIHGVKIKTNIPFTHGTQMPTITIIGYNFAELEGQHTVLGLNIVWYIYNGVFRHFSVSSFGGATPQIFLANENGKVIIFINEKIYYQRFTVSAFAQGMSEQSQWFSGWTAVDEPVGSTNKVEVSYKNNFAGNVGIGTPSPDYKLDVVGTVRAHEVLVNTQKGADFVFAKDYPLRPLTEVEQFINTNKHLPDIAPADSMIQNGVNMSEMQIKLLQKIEELTLYVIELKKENKAQHERIKKLESKLEIK